MKFEEFPFVSSLHKAIDEIGFVDCTPVQAQSFRAYFEGKDIYAQSQTGTGKTVAFMLCGLQELIQRNRAPAGSQNQDSLKFAGDIKMLILSPTRELAEQIEEEAKLLAQFLPLQIAAFYGGVGYGKQRAHLDSGVQIITGTPGRIIDLTKSGELPLNQVQVMVLDEADRMLDMGFIDDVRWIMAKLPPASERLTMFYSATLNARVGNLTWEFMRSDRIAEIMIEPEQITTKNVEQELYHVSNQEKLRLLLSLIEKHKPDSAIIFCNTKSGTAFLENRLRSNGYQVKALMGDLPQSKRIQIVGQLKAGKLRLVVATDVASRGLHIEGLPLVLNYDLPDEAENYVHRIGRTARAGTSGKAISLACERYIYNLTDIERYIEDKIPVLWFPEEEWVEELIQKTQSRAHRETQRETQRKTQAQHTERRRGRPADKPKRSPQRDPERDPERDPSTAHREAQKETQAQHTERPTERSRRNSRNSDRNRRPRHDSRRSNNNAKEWDNRARPEQPRARAKDRIPKDKDQRLKYYQQKYGENFGIEAERKTIEAERKTTAHGPGRPASRSGSQRKDHFQGPKRSRNDSSGNSSGRGSEHNRNTGPQPPKQKPETAAESNKPSLWQRLSGKLFDKLFDKEKG